MAHGMGVPVEDASTIVNFDKTANYHIYVRTFNWTSPWSKSGAGKFKLAIDNEQMEPCWVAVAMSGCGNMLVKCRLQVLLTFH